MHTVHSVTVDYFTLTKGSLCCCCQENHPWRPADRHGTLFYEIDKMHL